MARIAGINIPPQKHAEIGLTYIYGIGRSTAERILNDAGISHEVKVNEWNDDQLNSIRTIINELKVEGALRSEVQLNIKRLVDLGCDAIVVSNHGGRQLDGARATLVALPEVVQAVDGRIPVWLDGGVRRGGDIGKALALGAQGVLLGRATLYGAIAAGEPGAMRALEILRDELQRTLQLCGVRQPHELTPDLLARNG